MGLQGQSEGCRGEHTGRDGPADTSTTAADDECVNAQSTCHLMLAVQIVSVATTTCTNRGIR